MTGNGGEEGNTWFLFSKFPYGLKWALWRISFIILYNMVTRVVDGVVAGEVLEAADRKRTGREGTVLS